jgi:cytidine deaminase
MKNQTSIQDLLERATEARDNAYAPYSNFSVGACLRGAKGGLYAGCNVENSAYPCGTCAESGAIAAMVLAGESQIKEILVIGPDDEHLCTPCGGCRQRLHEFADAATPVYIHSPGGLQLSTTLGQLLPHSFELL